MDWRPASTIPGAIPVVKKRTSATCDQIGHHFHRYPLRCPLDDPCRQIQIASAQPLDLFRCGGWAFKTIAISLFST